MSQVDGGDDDGRTADAGEYVLGTLSAEERTRLEARTADDPELRALRMVPRCADRSRSSASEDASGDLWARISSAINRSPATTSSTPPEVVELSAWRRRVARWRATAITATAASLVLATLLPTDLLTPEPGLLPVRRFVVLVDSVGQAQFLLEARADGRVLARPVGRPDRPDGRSLELWSIGADATPRSLGLLPLNATSLSRLKAWLRSLSPYPWSPAAALQPARQLDRWC